VRKARALLDSLGFEPPAELAGAREPEWSCCGCTLGHAGLKDVQRSMQQANVDAWRAAGRPLVASFCATCRCGLRSYADAPGLGWGEGEAEQWRAAQVPLSSLLQGTTFAVDDAAAPPALYYHTPCHGAGGGHDLEFLRRVAGERLRKWTTDDCCGMGGVMQLGSPALSQRVGDDLWRRLDPEPGGQLVTGCSGCVLQLTATAPEGVSVAHWLDLLDL
jgi:glycolate oxidase iron-sulfur subunit